MDWAKFLVAFFVAFIPLGYVFGAIVVGVVFEWAWFPPAAIILGLSIGFGVINGAK
jgi:hypothetical protein